MLISQTWVTNPIHSYLTVIGKKERQYRPIEVVSWNLNHSKPCELPWLPPVVTIRFIKILLVVSIFYLTKWTDALFWSWWISSFRTVNNFKLLNSVVSLIQRKKQHLKWFLWVVISCFFVIFLPCFVSEYHLRIRSHFFKIFISI